MVNKTKMNVITEVMLFAIYIVIALSAYFYTTINSHVFESPRNNKV